MDKIGEMLQAAVNCDYDTLVCRAKEAVENLTVTFNAIDAESAQYVLMLLIAASVHADGTLSDLERKMVSDVWGSDEDGMEKLLSASDRATEMIDNVKEFAQVVDADTKANIVMLCMTFAAVDKTINKEESGFIRKLCE